MILTLPISHLINSENYTKVPGIKALEFKKKQPILEYPGPILFHSGKGIVDHDFMDYFDEILPFLNDNNFECFSFDIGPASAFVKTENYYYISESEPLSKGEILKLSKQRLSYVKDRFNGFVALENLNYFPTTAYSHVCDPGFFAKVVRENDVYCILDIAHAMISAHNLGIDWQDYFMQMPLERVKEIHLSAHGMVDGKWRDLHHRPNKETYKILEFIQKNLKKEAYIIVEFYEDFSELIEIYQEVFEWLKNKNDSNHGVRHLAGN